MRKITVFQIVVFSSLFVIILGCTLITTSTVFSGLQLGDFRGVILFVLGLVIFYIFSLIVFRLFMWVAPLNEGEVEKDSKQEFIYHVYILFFIMIFYPVMRSGFVPYPIMRQFYLALGARLGDNTYSAGIIHDPKFIDIGENSVIGQYALLIPHAMENDRLAHYSIRIGNNVTIGAHAVVLAGCVIEDNALVATGAVVTKGTHILAGEVWGGVPAKLIRKQK